MNNFTFTSIILYIFLLSPVEASEQPPPINNITFYTENYPPSNYLVNNKLKGISVDTLKAIWKHLNVNEQEIILLPWARGYRFALTQPNTALFTMSKTVSRENLFKWVGPIFNSTHVLIAKKSKHYKFENLGQIFDHTVVTIKGDISEISLQQVGFPPNAMASVSQIEQAFLLMNSGRVDMFVISIHGFNHLAKQLQFDPNDYEVVWKVNEIGNYFAFNINTPDEVIQTYQQAFDDIAKQRLMIKASYDFGEINY